MDCVCLLHTISQQFLFVAGESSVDQWTVFAYYIPLASSFCLLSESSVDQWTVFAYYIPLASSFCLLLVKAV